MRQRRHPTFYKIPEYEDAGLFKNAVSRMRVALVAQMQCNLRQDLIVRGFLGQDQEIAVVFAGRRVSQTTPLRLELQQLRAKVRRHAIAQGGSVAEDIDRARLLIEVEGAWRVKFARDVSGWETRSYHLMVARWTLIDGGGNIDVFGMPPALGQSN